MLSDILSDETTRERKANNLLLVYLDYLDSLMHFLSFVSVNKIMRNKLHLILKHYNDVIVFKIQISFGYERTNERNPFQNFLKGKQV